MYLNPNVSHVQFLLQETPNIHEISGCEYKEVRGRKELQTNAETETIVSVTYFCKPSMFLPQL